MCAAHFNLNDLSYNKKVNTRSPRHQAYTLDIIKDQSAFIHLQCKLTYEHLVTRHSHWTCMIQDHLTNSQSIN